MDASRADEVESLPELPLVYESPKDRLHRLAAEASCASGVHRPYKTVVWGRQLTKCLDCQARLPDDYRCGHGLSRFEPGATAGPAESG